MQILVLLSCCYLFGCNSSQESNQSNSSASENKETRYMDKEIKQKLIELQSTRKGPPIIPVALFFDGNNDLGSIGCNLGAMHPGIDRFKKILIGLSERNDVEAVYVQIYELDPGEGQWPFADTVYVIGTVSDEELWRILTPLQPDQIGPAWSVGIEHLHDEPLHAVWWD